MVELSPKSELWELDDFIPESDWDLEDYLDPDSDTELDALFVDTLF